MDALNLTLILTFCIIIPLSQATPKATQPRAIESFKPKITQQQIYNECSYFVTVKTSCSSTSNVGGAIDLIFGDAYGNQVSVPQLDGSFEACALNTYDIYGPCTSPLSPICSLYVYSSGHAGWILETVSVHNYIHDPVIFNYNTHIPEGGPYGFDYCADY